MVVRRVDKVDIGAAVQAIKDGKDVSRCKWINDRIINLQNVDRWTPTFEDIMAEDWEILD
jgi:hypothetical protein